MTDYLLKYSDYTIKDYTYEQNNKGDYFGIIEEMNGRISCTSNI